MSRKILLVVEGTRAEPRLVERLLQVYGLDVRYEVVSYDTNIHVLYNDMFSEGEDADMLSLTEVLKEREADPEKRAILEEDYSDTLLVFDYEPQDSCFDPEHLLEMQAHFNESTDEGKLFINYPMVEACRHFRCLPDPDFLERAVGADDEVCRYKELVGGETCRQNVKKLSREDLDAIISMTMRKALHICGEEYDSKNPRLMYDRLSLIGVLHKQNEQLAEKRSVWVLGTCLLFICDYAIGLVDFS